MAIRICPECGGKVSALLDACPHCHHSFAETRKCPECDALVPQGALTCPECGHPFEEEDPKEAKNVTVNAEGGKVVPVNCPTVAPTPQ